MTFPERIVIVHGYQAHPGAHWFPWLAERAAQLGGRVDVVALPDSQNPVRAAWEAAVADTIGAVDEGTWVIGHSLGSITALRWAASLPGDARLGGILLVAGFGEQLHTIPELDDYLAEAPTDADIARIREVAGAIRSIHSDDDAIVPPPYSERIAARLGVESIVVPGGGHFLDREGWLEAPEVLAALHV
ncbi:RBBP9/YdeN family alpha/beta hydrolase [Schumannella soli]|uniref:Serine hydrolase family protein n=1 Tax=Schumannella soli TaxID=2590779 RepID=A0A506YA48_9MICO|nr:alpha/beta hydrolase [Schumannella soli]TPW77977.1 serine hydrolase family protein [Schumannella soli]